MATFSRSDAARIIASYYPGLKYRITTAATVGLRPVFDFRPKLAWRSLCRGADSAVEIGLVKPNGAIDWKADIEPKATTTASAAGRTAPGSASAAPRPKPMKPREIAARLREAAATAPTDPTDERREFRFGTLVIRCNADAEAIRKVADKYQRGFRLPSSSNKPRLPSLTRPPNADELLRALEIELADPVTPRRPTSVQTSAMSAAA